MPFLWFFRCLFHGSLHALFSYKGSLQALGFFTCLFMVLYRPFLGFFTGTNQGSLQAFSVFFTRIVQVLYSYGSLHVLFS